ncbi:adenylate/guanylate cyclase catalytic domain protein, partial [Ancylostoma duodenale]
NPAYSSRSLQSTVTTSTKLTIDSKKDTQRHAFFLLGDDSVVARKHHVRPVFKKSDCAMLRKMRTIDHDNICKFLGLSLDGPQVLSVWRYCGRGSFKLPKHFSGPNSDYLWLAPEHIRDTSLAPTKEGDIYSFAIVCSEVITKKSAWDLENQDYDLDELVYKIKRGGRSPIRPLLETEDEHNSSLSLLVKDCWSEDIEMRPSCDQVKSLIKSMNHNKSSNLMDHVFNVLEQYASNLEDEVQARMKELTEEKKKSDILLYRMLPKQVAERLKMGQPVEPETFDCVTLFFSDVVSFTTLASRCTPLQVVNLLNDLYTVFDAIIDEHDVYKVETIGDGYLCVSGLPHRNGNEHAKEVAEMSFELLRAIRTFRIPHLPNEKINIRVGLHTGSVVTGVVGMTMPRYCLFGDAVNTASRMESNGKRKLRKKKKKEKQMKKKVRKYTMLLAGRVHISTDTMKFLTEVIGGYKTELRGEVIVKGKGALETHWLLTPEEQQQVFIE